MFWPFIVAVAAIYHAAKRRKRRPGVVTGLRALPVPRSQRSGDEGEAVVHTELLAALRWLCGDDFYLHPGALLLNHAPGTDFPTAEVDHLVVTPFGIFVVETKNWAGRIEPGPTEQTVVRIGADGQRDVRRSPMQQNRSKVAFLRSMLPGSWPVEGIAAFSHPYCDVSCALPLNLMRATDLRQWLRGRKSRYESRRDLPVNVPQARRSILAVSETGSVAIENHRQKVRENPKQMSIPP
ncbi:nuclease-like protein [Paraburkholderia sp. BL8N3]|nr:nuclease-related domain-containing protein [Paraburkholderia sp. BL8N3]TCK33428.1 nuclease-like protein [Paraburkholderia sp. BL8N3]